MMSIAQLFTVIARCNSATAIQQAMDCRAALAMTPNTNYASSP